MKIDKQTLMLFGGGLLAGYLFCKFMSKNDAPVGFSADGLMRAESDSHSKPHIGANPISNGGTPITMGGIDPFGSTGVLKPHIGANPNGVSNSHSNPTSTSPNGSGNAFYSRRRN
jgi:hypothetical protein